LNYRKTDNERSHNPINFRPHVKFENNTLALYNIIENKNPIINIFIPLREIA